MRGMPEGRPIRRVSSFIFGQCPPLVAGKGQVPGRVQPSIHNLCWADGGGEDVATSLKWCLKATEQLQAMNYLRPPANGLPGNTARKKLD